MINSNSKGQSTYAHPKMDHKLNLSDIDVRASILTMFHYIKENIHKMNENERKCQQINRKYKTKLNKTKSRI